MFNDRIGNNDDSSVYAGRLECTAYYPVGGSLQQNDDSYIMRQRGSNKFLVHHPDSTEATYVLKAVAPGSLQPGEMCVKAVITTDDSTNVIAYVSRFYNRTVHHVHTVAGQTITSSSKYILGTEANEDSSALQGSGFATLDVI